MQNGFQVNTIHRIDEKHLMEKYLFFNQTKAYHFRTHHTKTQNELED